MINRQTLLDVIKDQQDYVLKNDYILRQDIDESIYQNDLIIVISGIRRCGKSVLLQQIRKRYKQHNYYINLDDDRLVKFTLEDFQLLYEIYIELFGEQDVFFFDEIQNIPGWERFVRRLNDQGKKIYITGSNATMLSKELGTHLTGRYYQVSLYPFSFKEYLFYNKFNINNINGTKNTALIKKHFNEYLLNGGMPGYVSSKDGNYLKMQYEGLLYRDILARNKILNEHQVKELIYYIASNIGKELSFNSLAKLIGVKQASTVKEYLNMFENAYLSFLLSRYDASVKKQIYANKKIYFIDNALANLVGFRFSEDRGRFLENLVYLELKRRQNDLFFYKDKNECDFLIKSGNNVETAIQVTVSLTDTQVRTRELRGLLEAVKVYGLKEGYILTEDEEDELNIDDIKIKVIPIWRWLIAK